MASKTVLVQEPTYARLNEIRIVGNKADDGDAQSVQISYDLVDTQGNILGGGLPRAITVAFAGLTTQQKDYLRTVVTWALNQVIAAEGPFV